MKFKINKEAAQAMMAIGAGLAVGIEIWYLDFKARMQDEKNAVVNKEIENICKLMHLHEKDIDDLKTKVDNLELCTYTLKELEEGDGKDLFAEFKK